MRDYLGTAGMFLSIFVVITIMFMGPKGFSLSADKPVIAPLSASSAP